MKLIDFILDAAEIKEELVKLNSIRLLFLSIHDVHKGITDENGTTVVQIPAELYYQLDELIRK